MKQLKSPWELLPLMVTNLRIPELHGELISRKILMDRMDLALRFPLTLVSAPAGFGKTTLLSQWAADGRNEKLRDHIAWVGLESDSDVLQFWRYILTALERLQPWTAGSSLPLLDSSNPPINTIIKKLVNDIAALNDEFVLILDDYDHVNDPAIHTTLTFLINHLPPNMHLVLASRSSPPLPLARWRVNNQLYELREDELRFTPEEMAFFLNEIKRLDLSTQEITALGVRTEGWIAGLQLVALSLKDSDETTRRQFVFEFAGSQRYILDYLVEEVLQQQPEHIRTFLLQTSVLDRLSASLCNAVTGEQDGQIVLEHLARAHLFTIPLDHEQHWYRYHHLFRDMLRHRLQQRHPDIVFELHRRAAAWHAESGRTDDAVRHACYAQKWDRVIELIEPEISTAWNRGEIRKIINWLGQLPASHLDLHPTLSLYYSRALLLGGRMDAAEQRLLESEKVLRQRVTAEPKTEDRLLLWTICAFRTTIAAVTGETTAAQALGNEALSLLPPDQQDIRAHALNSLGVSYYYSGDMDRAAQACSEAVRLAQRVGNLYLAMAAASYQAHSLECEGQLRQAMKILEQALDLSKTPGVAVQSWIPAASATCASYGSLLYEWNQLEESEKYLTEAIELGQRLAFGSALWYAYHMLGRIRLAQGDQKNAETMVEQAQMYRLTYTVPLPERLMDAEQARASLALGQLELVERWATSLQSDRTDTPMFVQEVEDMTLARFYLLQNRPEAALTLLDRLRLSAESGGRIGHLIPTLALTAVAQHAQGDTPVATDTLQTALKMAEPEGYLRTFIDAGQPMAHLLYQTLELNVLPHYVSRLLTLFPRDHEIKHPDYQPNAISVRANTEPILEPLSERELEVLQWMATGASNEEIAQALIIATTTAKKHVSNIIRKFGVENRTQAVARGRSLGLCQ
jgi:LuxR family maltose regulon positive regulatory protein